MGLYSPACVGQAQHRALPGRLLRPLLLREAEVQGIVGEVAVGAAKLELVA